MSTLVNNLRAIRGPVTAVPMVGASGVVIEADTQNNQVVVRADETVLWEGEAVSGSIQLSEAGKNFEYLEVYGDTLTGWSANARPQLYGKCECITNYTEQIFAMNGYVRTSNGNLQQRIAVLNVNNTTLNIQQPIQITITSSGALSRENTNIALRRVVGVNRKSS